MRWLVVVIAVVSLLTLSYSSWAGGVGNRADTIGRFKLAVSGEYERLFDRDLDLRKFEWKWTNAAGAKIFAGSLDPGERVSGEYESNRGFANIVFGVADWLDFYVKLGGANLDAEAISKEPGDRDKDDFRGSGDFAWVGGAKARLYQKGNFKILGDFQVFSHRSDASSKINGVPASVVLPQDWGAGFTGIEKTRVKVSEVQGAFYALHRMGPLDPYFGVKIAAARVNLHRKIHVFDTTGAFVGVDHHEWWFREDKPVGVVVGLDGIFLKGDRLSFNIEGQFINETALTAGFVLKFY